MTEINVESLYHDFISEMNRLGFSKVDEDGKIDDDEYRIITEKGEISYSYYFMIGRKIPISRHINFNVNQDLITERQLKIIRSMFVYDGTLERTEVAELDGLKQDYLDNQNIPEGEVCYTEVVYSQPIYHMDYLRDTVFNDKKVLEMAGRVIRDNRY